MTCSPQANPTRATHLLHGSKADASKSVQLEHQLLPRLIRHQEDVAFLANAQPAADGHNRAARDECSQRQVVVACVRQRIPIVLLSIMAHQFVAQQCLERLADATVLHGRDSGDERSWHKLVVLHAHLHSAQHAPVIRLQVPQVGHIKLHGYGRHTGPVTTA